MKKLFLIGAVVIVVMTMCVSAFANPGSFVASPSLNPAPELVEGTNESKDCEAEIVITAYGNRDQLATDARQAIEGAYADIVGAVDITTLNVDLAAVAEKLGVDASTLAVSDLFDISATNCNKSHEKHGKFDITLKSETLDNFVCLLHFHNGEWHIVDGAEVTNNGEHLEFEADEFSPFAIVVSTEEVVAPKKNNIGWIIALSVGGASAVGGGTWFAISYFKKKKKAVI